MAARLFTKERTFTIDDIAAFSEATDDHMLPHDPAYMRGKEKLPIVHGLFVLLSAVDPVLFEHRISQDKEQVPNFITANFGAAVSVGDTVMLGAEYGAISPFKVRLLASKDGKNALTYSNGVVTNETTLGYLRDQDNPLLKTGVPESTRKLHIVVDRRNYLSFARLIGVRFNNESNKAENARESREADSDYVSRLKHAIALSSGAIIKKIKNGETANALELAEGFGNETKRMLPVYTTTKIFFPSVIAAAQATSFDFATEINTADQRNYKFTTECTSDGQLVYRMRSEVTVVPEAIVLRRVARSIPKAA